MSTQLPPRQSKARDSATVRPLDADHVRDRSQAPDIPDHEIIRCIGYGAYGEVWLARSITGTYRAIKTIWREDFQDEASFRREFEGVLFYEPIARSHHGLVHILHIGQLQGDFPMYYYVMELADDAHTGHVIEPERYTPRTLLNDIRRYDHSPMPIDQVISVGCQLARALRYLHGEDLAHRDIKPANIIFVHDRAKLADAGLIVHGAGLGFVGTQGYIPPDGPGTPRADVYALALVLYEMISGKDRMEFPDLPDETPDQDQHQKWLSFNRLICQAASAQIDENAVTTAADFLKRLEAIRDGKYQMRSISQRTSLWRRAWKIALTLLILIMLLLAFQHFPSNWMERMGKIYVLLTHPGADIKIPTPTGHSTASSTGSSSLLRQDEGQVYIISNPTNASVYKINGDYISDTPIGPILLPKDTQVRLMLRKPGYVDMMLEGRVEANEVLSLGGDLYPLDLPVEGKPWHDVMGSTYAPDAKGHLSNEPIERAHFEQFLKEQGVPDEDQYEILLHEPTGKEIILTNSSTANLYAEWLMERCSTQGLLDESYIMLPKHDSSIQSGSGLLAYGIIVSQLPQTPITIFSNPAGASVMVNGKFIGVTPIVRKSIPLAPYHIELRLQRHKVIHHSGISPEGLRLNFQLETNNAVTFNAPWFNSLGQQFIPLSAKLMVGATEVRIGDFLNYCKMINAAAPPQPEYPHNEHYPIVNVTREEAQKFAQWLTLHERALGLIEDSDAYRLPTDQEWSRMAGIDQEEGDHPFDRNLSYVKRGVERYAWGESWPPSNSTGNFADKAAIQHVVMNRVIENYEDGYAYASPVGSFKPNALGAFDMDGNVQEWVSDPYGGPPDFRFLHYGVVRGGSFCSFHPTQVSSYSRTPKPGSTRDDHTGFRLVLERRALNF